jgi:steroid 5-alpha reductase family enzyme
MDGTVVLLIYGLYTTLIITVIGFKKTVWFISIGYTFSVITLCATTLLFATTPLHLYNWLQLFILGFWGIRLGSFILKRESNTQYTQAVKNQTDASQQQSVMVKAGIWISVSVLYVMMFSPAIFALQTPNQFTGVYTWVVYAGVAVMFTGFILEALADYQKSKFKATQPHKHCNVGLFTWVRCPNYLGEITVWTGNLIVGIPFYSSWWHIALAVFGWVCIVLIMIGSTKRLDEKQIKSYGSSPDFQKYIQTVPVLFPWLPIYSLSKVKVYLE